MEENTNTQQAEETEKTYSEKDLQSYADKRVSEALKTARTKFENEKKEAERLASMTAEERFQEELTKREQALLEREKMVQTLENKQTATKILADKGISINLVDLVLADTAEDMKSRIDLLEKEFNLAVQQEIERRIGGNTPRANTGTGGITADDFKKMSIRDRQALAMSNPDLFNRLIGE